MCAQIQWRDRMSHFISLISPIVSLLLLWPGGGGRQGPPGGWGRTRRAPRGRRRRRPGAPRAQAQADAAAVPEEGAQAAGQHDLAVKSYQFNISSHFFSSLSFYLFFPVLAKCTATKISCFCLPALLPLPGVESADCKVQRQRQISSATTTGSATPTSYSSSSWAATKTPPPSILTSSLWTASGAASTAQATATWRSGQSSWQRQGGSWSEFFPMAICGGSYWVSIWP